MTSAAAILEHDYPSKDSCAKCHLVWTGSGTVFAVLVGFGDGRAHVIHHDCPDPAGRDWWTEPAPIRPAGNGRRRPRFHTRPRANGIEDEITAALTVIRAVAQTNREVTAAAWRKDLDQAGISEQARQDAVRRAVTVLHWFDLVDLHGGRVELADIDRKTPRFRSRIYIEPRGPRGVDPNAGKPRL